MAFVAVAAIVFGLVAAVVSIRLPTTYEAGTTLLIGRSTTGSDPGYQDLLASQLLAQTYAELATTRPILSAVATRLHLAETPEELARSIRVEAAGLNPIVRVNVQGRDAVRVAAIANEVGQQLIDWKPTDRSTDVEALIGLQQTLATIDGQIARAEREADALQEPGGEAAPGALQSSLDRLASLLSTRATLLQLITNTSSDSVRVIEPAVPPQEAAQTGIVLNVTAAALLGALLSAGVLYAASSFRRVSDTTPSGG